MDKSILVVEDSVEDRNVIKEYLKNAGFYNLSFATSYDTAIKLLNRQKFDTVLIDINLDDNLDGITLAATIDKDFYLPYVFVTGQHMNNGGIIFQEVAELKCRNFVTKPINKDDLISNLQIAIRSYQHYVQIANNAKYDFRNKKVYINDKEIKLTGNKNKLLNILAQNINRFVSREAIKYHIWEDKPPKAGNALRQLKKDLLTEFNKYNIKLNIDTHFFNGYKLIF